MVQQHFLARLAIDIVQRHCLNPLRVLDQDAGLLHLSVHQTARHRVLSFSLESKRMTYLEVTKKHCWISWLHIFMTCEVSYRMVRPAMVTEDNVPVTVTVDDDPGEGLWEEGSPVYFG